MICHQTKLEVASSAYDLTSVHYYNSFIIIIYRLAINIYNKGRERVNVLLYNTGSTRPGVVKISTSGRYPFSDIFKFILQIERKP